MATPAQPLHSSTGPRTEAGKATSSKNAIKHGLAAEILFIPDEDPAAFEAFHLSLKADLRPTTAIEQLLVTDMAKHHWLMDRAIRLQALALVRQDFQKVDLLLRYQNANHRAFHKALATLQAMRKQFVSQSHTQPTETRFVRSPPPTPIRTLSPQTATSTPPARESAGRPPRNMR